MADEVTLSVDVPEVVEAPVSVQVRCGKTEVEVREYGVQGSGSWAVWLARGRLVYTGLDHYAKSLDEALADARDYVRSEERSRLLHRQLRNRLEVADG